jgi:hypothetical protein
MPRSRAGSNLLCLAMGFFLMAASLVAAERPTLFEEANRLYEQGKYAEAVSQYESIVKGGRRSAGVFFNLGNAYFKQGNLGHALLNYLRAEALAPRDPDIQANLRFTRDRVTNSVSIQHGITRRMLNYFTPNELARITGLIFWIWAALYCVIRIQPSLRTTLRTPQLIAGILLVLFVSVFVAAAGTKQSVVIVTSRQATVHLGPLPESQPAFTAPDGTELRFLEARPDWLQVSDRTGRTGWLRSKDAAIFHGS